MLFLPLSHLIGDKLCIVTNVGVQLVEPVCFVEITIKEYPCRQQSTDATSCAPTWLSSPIWGDSVLFFYAC